jgi:hypothetical protein
VSLASYKRLLLTLIILITSECSYGVWKGEEMHPRVVDKHPSRLRFEYSEPIYETKLMVRQIEITVKETRDNLLSETDQKPVMSLPKEGETVKVSLHRSFLEQARAHVAGLPTGQGPTLKLTMVVRQLSATRTSERYQLEAVCEHRLSIEDSEPFLVVESGAKLQLLAPPYDAQELDELHRAIGLRLLDQLFTSYRNIERINHELSARGEGDRGKERK